MAAEAVRPTRREQRRAQTLQEIKALAMDQISSGGPAALSLSGIVREMAMSPAAVYRYFENRDALLGELVVDAYNDFADFMTGSPASSATAEEHLRSVLHAARAWALGHSNAYRLIFQTSVGAGKEPAAERTRSAATRSMAAIVSALDAASPQRSVSSAATPDLDDVLETTIADWSKRAGFDAFSPAVLALGLASWTRLHGVISLELEGHLGATGLDPALLYGAEVAAITRAVQQIVH